jgi:hypothetical protein
MRALPFLALLSLAPAATAAAQAIVVPARCQGACPAAERPRGTLTLDTVGVWASLDSQGAVTYVSHAIRNHTPAEVDGALFFPLPRGAVVERVMVYEAYGALDTYNEWSGPAESRRMVDEIVREQPRSALRGFAGMEVVHVRVRAIPAGGTRKVQIGYREAPRARGAAQVYRYPLAMVGAGPPVAEFTLRLTVKTGAGFVDLRSPSHAVDVRWGTEIGRCPPQARCGFTSVPSRRVKEVRMENAAAVRTRDFVLVYTPAAGPYRPEADADTAPAP